LRSLPTVATLRHLRQILSADPRPRGKRVVRVRDSAEMVLTADRPLPFQVDGDDFGDTDRVVLRSVPDALSVVV
jgi:diacylglycerol kinase family enzyme